MLNRKLRDSQIQAGVEFMLDPLSNPRPKFHSMTRPRAKRQRIKMEDLEDELDDEEFKMPLKKPKIENARRSRRLHLAQLKKESGEYFEEQIEVDIKVSDERSEDNDTSEEDSDEEDDHIDSSSFIENEDDEIDSSSSDEEDIDKYLTKSLNKFNNQLNILV